MPYRSPSASSRTSPNFDLWLKLGLTTLITGVMAAKAHALTMTPYLPHTADSVAGIPTVYYAHGITPSATVYVDTADGYPNYNLNDPSYQLNFDLSGLDTAKVYLYAYAEHRTTAGAYFQIPFRAASAGGSLFTPSGAPTGSNGALLNGVLTNGSVEIDVHFNLKDICAYAPNAKGCDTGTPGNVDTSPTATGFTIRLYQSETNTGSAFANTDIDAAGGLDLSPATVAPVINNGACPTDISSWFFPGDGSIFVQTGAFTGSKGTPGVGSSVFNRTIVSAAAPTLTNGTYLSNLKGRLYYNAGDQEVEGFENSTNAVPVLYQANIGVRDSAGIITFCNAPYSNIFASDIRSFLKESNCFVATASFRSGTTPEVMMLRKFRDEVLSNFELGRAFISFYYSEGPKAADWLIAHPQFRVPVLLLLVPVQAAAWVALNPMIALSPFVAFLLFGLLYRRRALRHGMKIAPLVLAFAFSAPNAQAEGSTGSNQPFIDSLLSEIGPSKEPVRTNGNPDPYIQEQKKKLGASESGGSFIEEEKKRLGEAQDTDGYSAREQRRLGKKSGGDSAIADFKSGRELKPNKGGDRTRSAFAIKVSTAMNRTYLAGSAEDLSYEEVYGAGYVPEITLTYEYRPFNAPVARNLGIFGSLGGSFKTANGKFAYTQNTLGALNSKAKFRFIVLPVNLGPIYRFSLGNFAFPYFGGGGSAVGFIESRTDAKEGMRGYSFGYWGVAGVSFGLDWISPKTSWESFESTGTKHTYLSIEYSYLQTLGGLIETTVDGVQAGLTFEF